MTCISSNKSKSGGAQLAYSGVICFLRQVSTSVQSLKQMKFTKLQFLSACTVLLSLSASSASAVVNVLTFEGVGNQVAVGNFYNGGAGGNLGITFSSNSLGIVDSDAGGGGNFGGEPSPSTAMFFLGGSAATMSVSGGFTTGFSFFYSAVNQTGSVTVFDGLNGTGNILATLSLPLTPFNGAPDPTGTFSPFVPIGVTFSGTAMSVNFGGAINQIAFDDITLGSSNPGGSNTPDGGSTVALMGTCMVALLALRRKLG